MRTIPLLLVCGALLTSCTYAQSASPMPGMEHHHHDDTPEQLGHVSFPTSCAARSQAPMERGVALLHSFGYTVAQMQFEAIAKDDPACAMAHWGIAMTQFQELWGRPDAAALKRGAEEMAKARALAAPPATITPREQAYIAALSAFFDPADIPFQQRADAYEAKMNALHREFPEDVEGAAFDALSMLASVAPDDTSLTHEHQALAILVPLFAAHPEHPGLAHYIIHTCDTPALAPTAWGLRGSMPGLRLRLRMRCTCRAIFLPGWACGKRISIRTWLRWPHRRRRKRQASPAARTRCMRRSS